MRVAAYQFGLSVSLLLAWPLLGGGNPVQAAFLVQTNSASEAGEMGAAGTEFDKSPTPSDDRLPEGSGRVHLLRWTGAATTGAGCGSASGSTTGGSAVFPAALDSEAKVSPTQLVRWLYFEDLHYRPPPFASRLFRPPRSV
jgi:hypothetical protein